MEKLYNNPMYKNWGKSKSFEDGRLEYHLLVYHCLDVAAVGNILLEKDDLLIQKFINATGLSKENTISLISFLLALHDIGKFSERFQFIKPPLLKKLRGHETAKDYNMRHDSMGFRLWYEVWPEVWGENWLRLDHSTDKYDWEDTLIPWIQAVTGHHGRPPSCCIQGIPVNPKTQFTKEDVEMASYFVKEISAMFLEQSFDPSFKWNNDMENKFERSSWLLAGLVILSDWIGSNDEWFHYCSKYMTLTEYWENCAIPQAEAAVEMAGVLPSEISQKTGMKTLFPGFDKTPRPLQEYVSKCKITDIPQLFILEDSTGSGKTEAGAVLAHRLMAKGLAEGIFIALPTMATSTAMYKRMEEAYTKLFISKENIFSKPSLILAHSSSNLIDKFKPSIGLDEASFTPEHSGKDEETASAQCATWLADNRKKALLADVGVGTIDQILMAVLPTNHQSLRILGMSKKVLIIDEVHAYDPYMNTLLCTLLSFHSALGGSAILLSATLAIKQRQELANSFCKGLGVECNKLNETAYPLVTVINANDVSETPIEALLENSREIEVEFLKNTSQVKSRLREIADKGGCVCWIRNTVDDAVAAYEELSSEIGGKKILLFHARFALGDRLNIEENVLYRFGKKSTPEIRCGYILIATQVVEQSLDLDFDYMVSDLAPIDLLIQRAGRIHRHKRKGRDSCILLGILAPGLTETPDQNWYSDFFSKATYVYPSHGQLWLTARQLAKRGNFKMPDDARNLIESVFGSGSRNEIPETLRDRDDRVVAENNAAISIAQLNSLDIDDGYEIKRSQWQSDAITPTRLGELTIAVRLARWDGKNITPWYEAEKFSWQFSQVSMDQRKIKAQDEFSSELKVAVDNALQSMHDKGKWSILVPLSPTNGNEWQGYAKDSEGKRVRVIYNNLTGLRINH